MPEIIIIGGGVLGMLTARELRLAGTEVALLEKGEMARESSWAGGGIISPLYPWRYADCVTELASWSQAQYPALCEELLERTGIDPEYTRSGLLIVAPGEMNEATAWARRFGRQLETVGRKRIAELEPALNAPPAEAAWMDDVAQVRNPRITKALARYLEVIGVQIHTHTEVKGLLHAHGRISGVRTAHGTVECDKVVVCTGAWSGSFLEELPKPPEVRPIRGQMILFRAEPGVIRRMVLEENRYIIPRRDGRVLFGSSIEETGFDKSITPEIRAELEQLAVERFPVLADYPIEHHWAGLRPGSPSGIPYVARHHDIDNLFINAGHFRNGVVLGPASARLSADMVLDREPLLPPAPYALDAVR